MLRKLLTFVSASLLLLLPGAVLAAPSTTFFLNIAPTVTDTYSDGTTANRWLNFYTKYASTTALTVSGQGTGCAQFDSTSLLTTTGSACGSGTVGVGTQGQFPFYNANGTALTATSTFFITQAGNIGIGTTTPSAAAAIQSKANATGLIIQTDGSVPVTSTNDLVTFKSGTTTLGRFTNLGNFVIGGNTSNALLQLDATQSQFGGAFFGIAIKSVGAFQDFNNNAGTTLLRISQSGNQYLFVGSGLYQSNATGQVALTVRGANGNTVDIQQWNDFVGNLSKINKFGEFSTGTSTPWGRIAVQGIAGSTTPLINLASSTQASRFIVDSSGNVGIGTSSPPAPFTMLAASSTIPVGVYNGLVSMIAGLENTTTKLFQTIDQWGHMVTGGDTPTVSGGTSTVAGNDNNGNITVAGTLLTSITLTFSHPWLTAPDCTMADSSTSITGAITSITTTQLVVGFSAGINSGNVWYQCSGHQ